MQDQRGCAVLRSVSTGLLAYGVIPSCIIASYWPIEQHHTKSKLFEYLQTEQEYLLTSWSQLELLRAVMLVI